MTYEIEIGRGKRGRRAYSLDDIAIVPNRRTRDPKDVSVSWQIDAYKFDMPVIAAPMDSAMSPETVIALGRLGGLGVLDLEGLWTRYENPQSVLDEIAGLADETNSPAVTRRMQELYRRRSSLSWSPPASPRSAPPGVTVAGSLTRSARRNTTRPWWPPASTSSSSAGPLSRPSTSPRTTSR
ncbi:hypothetical protein NicSoilC12_06290 [Arthrobacter sp. NicSoilC12]|nr:hypothetical protein NicSoilC12_06290 [Arthrobacter sp. NicSoilC12]